jgi:hypothetical protein
MPRINEHKFIFENIDYKLTFFPKESAIVYINEKIYTGNKTVLLKKYIAFLGLDIKLDGLTPQQLSSIVLKHFSGQNNSQNKKISPKSSTKTTIQKPIDKQIEELLENLDWKKLKDKKTPKLLIIGCCNAKSQQPIGLANGGFANYNFGNAINTNRIIRRAFYTALPANHFVGRPNGAQPYYLAALNNANRRQALDVYDGAFYQPILQGLYRLKIANCNLHLLIVSGLYGIIKHDDYINDYHLEITDGPNIWANNITNSIREYIKVNNINNDEVFYSLSNNYLNFITPLPIWKNLWLQNGRIGSLWTSANIISKFLNNL